MILHQQRQPQVEANRAKRATIQAEKLARTEKPCARCKQVKLVDAFRSHPSYCKKCLRQLDKEYGTKPSRQVRKKETDSIWRKTNRKHINEYKKGRLLIPEIYDNERAASNARNRRYYQQHKDKYFAQAAKRRAAVKALYSEKIDRLAIAERDNWICYICGQEVRRDEMSMDHVIPVALDGPRSVDNIRLAHLKCNKRKGISIQTTKTLLLETAR